MKDSLFYSPMTDDISAAVSAESIKNNKNFDDVNNNRSSDNNAKRSSPSNIVDLTDSPIHSSKRQSIEEPIVKKAPTIGIDSSSSTSSSSFIPPIRIGGTSLLPTNRLSVGSTVSTSDSPVAQAEEAAKITLSTSQKHAIDAIMARKSVFFSGAAGSGKSFLLKVVQDVLDSLDKGDRIVSLS